MDICIFRYFNLKFLNIVVQRFYTCISEYNFKHTFTYTVFPGPNYHVVLIVRFSRSEVVFDCEAI